MTAGRAALAVAGTANLGVALLHAAMVVVGPAAYLYFGAGPRFAARAAAGSPVPAVVTLMLAVAFAVMGLYALSGARCLPRLPLLRTVILLVGVVYVLRGLVLVPELRALLVLHAPVAVRMMVFSGVSLAIGLLYLAGAAAEWGTLSRRSRD